jgi:predicted Rossmann fold flavoprotein
MDFDVIVLGAGAAGMMCAATAGQRGRRVLLIDHSTELAEKIRISGGGRCNFTNRDVGPRNFLSRNPHFCRSALARYTPRDFIALIERHNISYHERNLGQLFCDDSAKQIIAMLKAECDAAAVQWAMPVTVDRVAQLEGDAPGFEVATTQGTYRSSALVVATGGLSIPKIGATPFGYRLAEQFGLAIVPPKPALVPLAAPPEWLERFGALSGSSFDAVMSCVELPRGTDWPAFREAALITHRGLSGPSILQVSSYWQQGGARGPVAMDLLPDLDAGAWLNERRRDQQGLGALLAEHLPRRFAISFAELHGWTQPLTQLSNATLATIAQTLKGWPIQPSGTLGYAKAEVTLGGVDTDALSQQTLEARSVPGLHFIGEVVDVTGWLGGYNFQWAWASGQAAGSSV